MVLSLFLAGSTLQNGFSQPNASRGPRKGLFLVVNAAVPQGSIRRASPSPTIDAEYVDNPPDADDSVDGSALFDEASASQETPFEEYVLSAPEERQFRNDELLYNCPATLSGPPQPDATLCHTAGTAGLPRLPLIPTAFAHRDQRRKQLTVKLTADVSSTNFFDDHYYVKSLRLSRSESVSPLSRTPTYQLPDQYDANLTRVWTFNNGYPGPTIRAEVGDVLDLILENNLPVATGVFIPGIYTSREPLEGGFVNPGETRMFSIPLPVEGTYLYSSPIDSHRQVPLGLHGLLIVSPETNAADSQSLRKLAGDDESKSPEEHALILSDALLVPSTWQFAPSFQLPEIRAKENVNGRIGNILLVNGRSTSSGQVLELKGGSDIVLHIANAALARTMILSITNAQLEVESRFAGADLYGFNYNRTRSHMELPSGGTATVTVKAASIRKAELRLVLLEDPKAKHVFAIPAARENDGSTILAETWTGVKDANHTRIVELLMVPYDDRFASYGTNTIATAEELMLMALQKEAPAKPEKSQKTAADPVYLITQCEPRTGADAPPTCGELLLGFDLADSAPPKAHLEDASLLFEIGCSSEDAPRRIKVALFGVSAAEMSDDPLAPLPNPALMDLIRSRESHLHSSMKGHPLVQSVVGCEKGRFETPVDLRGFKLKDFLSEHIANKTQEQPPPRYIGRRPSLVWLRLSISHNTSLADSVLSAASRTSESLPPPMLRVVYKTSDEEAEHFRAQKSIKPPTDVKAAKRRIERVFHELQNEQEDMKVQLQTIYARVQRKQRLLKSQASSQDEYSEPSEAETEQRGFLAADSGGSPNPAEVLAQLEEHLKQQEEQREVERQLLVLKKSQLPESQRKQLRSELHRRLQQHYLRQRLHQDALKRSLESLHSSSGSAASNVLKKDSTSKFFRGSPHTEETAALRREKAIYMKLYGHYNDLVGQLKHLKETSDSLDELYPAEARGLQSTSGSPRAILIYSAGSSSHVTPETLLRFTVAATIPAGDARPKAVGQQTDTNERQPLVTGIREIADKGGRLLFVSEEDGTPVPTITLTLGMKTEGDIDGNMPMWIGVHKEHLNRPLQPGSLILWDIRNPTIVPQTLYFHRTYLEVFRIRKAKTEKNVTREVESYNHLAGVTIPASAELSNDGGVVQGVTTVWAVSQVPRITAGPRSFDAFRWDIRINSMNLHHVSLGMTTRIELKVNALQGENGAPGPVNGIDRAAVGIVYEGFSDFGRPRPRVSVALGAAAVGGIAVFIYSLAPCYKKGRQRLLRGRRMFGSASIKVSQPCDMSEGTPGMGLEAGGCSTPNESPMSESPYPDALTPQYISPATSKFQQTSLRPTSRAVFTSPPRHSESPSSLDTSHQLDHPGSSSNTVTSSTYLRSPERAHRLKMRAGAGGA